MAIGRVPGATGIQPSIVDAKGDLIAATAADSVSRLAIGANNTVLTADSAEATGLKYANGSRATLTTTGDILYASAANTPARLAIGSSAQVLTVSGGIPAWATPAGGGKVLQVVTAVTQTSTNISSPNYTDSSITATITPTLNTSKIMVIVSGQVCLTRSASASRQTRLASRILRGATEAFTDSNGQSFGVQYTATTTGSVEHFNRVALSVLDSPATTSATTYKVQYSGDTNWNIEAQQGSAMSSIILLEIGA